MARLTWNCARGETGTHSFQSNDFRPLLHTVLFRPLCFFRSSVLVGGGLVSLDFHSPSPLCVSAIGHSTRCLFPLLCLWPSSSSADDFCTLGPCHATTSLSASFISSSTVTPWPHNAERLTRLAYGSPRLSSLYCPTGFVVFFAGTAGCFAGLASGLVANLTPSGPSATGFLLPSGKRARLHQACSRKGHRLRPVQPIPCCSRTLSPSVALAVIVCVGGEDYTTRQGSYTSGPIRQFSDNSYTAALKSTTKVDGHFTAIWLLVIALPAIRGRIGACQTQIFVRT